MTMDAPVLAMAQSKSHPNRLMKGVMGGATWREVRVEKCCFAVPIEQGESHAP